MLLYTYFDLLTQTNVLYYTALPVMFKLFPLEVQ